MRRVPRKDKNLVRVQLWIKGGDASVEMKAKRLKMPPDVLVSAVMTIARPNMHIQPRDAIFAFAPGNILLSPQMSISSAHEKHAVDGILNLTCAKEEVFG